VYKSISCGGSVPIKRFYAVTMTSVYKVAQEANGMPLVEKIFLKGGSQFGVGHKLRDGTMVSVGRQIITFIPEGGGMTSFQRKIEMVNTRYWGGQTSYIAALFFTRKEALACIKSKSLKSCDSRWIDQTRSVLATIGDDHPTFSVCHYKEMALIPEQ